MKIYNEAKTESIDIDIPAWMEKDSIPHDTLEELASWARDLSYGGCESGTYMPAVRYYAAGQTMNQHGDEILTYIEYRQGDDWHGLSQAIAGSPWSRLCCYFVSMAVELWASEVEAMTDGY